MSTGEQRASRPNAKHRFGLVPVFGLTSAVVIVVLGVVLANVLQRDIREQALSGARREVQAVAETISGTGVTAHELKTMPSEAHLTALDAALSHERGQVVRVKIWNADGRVLYSDDHQLIGQRFPDEGEVGDAMRGRTSSSISNLSAEENVAERASGKLLEVYTPLHLDNDREPSAVFEAYLPYTPLAASIEKQTRNLYIVLAVGLGLLWLALFRLVSGASRDLRTRAAENLHLATHDPLTGLLNRHALKVQLDEAIEMRHADRGSLALLLLDLDRFKVVNDTLGHQTGDLLLRELGARLAASAGPGDVVARLGGDEFALLLPSASAVEAQGFASELLTTLQQPIGVGAIELTIEGSIGIACWPVDAADGDLLLQHADVALNMAKRTRGRAERYSHDANPFSPARLALLSDLHRAIEGNELVLYFQPKATIASGHVDSVEALIRWQHPRLGLLGPDAFIPLAEPTGIMVPITEWVVETALAQQEAWRAQGLDLEVSVNLSARSLHDRELDTTVHSALSRHQTPAGRLTLEITESAVITDVNRAQRLLRKLSHDGVRIAIDDFGAGYTSFAQLGQLPVDELKIDKSFVLGMLTDSYKRAVVASVIDLGNSLGVDVVAEGAETDGHWSALGDLGCPTAQGYGLARPLPAEELTRWLLDRADAVPVP